MHFTIGQPALKRAVELAGAAASTRSTLPVLGNILLRAADGQLTATGTNLSLALAVTVPAEVREAGDITLPTSLLTALVAGIDSTATVTVSTDPVRMAAQITYTLPNVRGQKGPMVVKGIDAAEYPLIPTAAGEALTLTGAELSALIRKSAFAAAGGKDTSRPALTGVLVQIAPLRAAATDGYRLALAELPAVAQYPSGFERVILPADALKMADKLAGEAERVAVALAGNGAQCGFRFTATEKAGWQSATLVSQSIDGKFPDYHAIIPQSKTLTATVDTAAFVRVLKMAALFAKDNSDRVVLKVEPGLSEELSSLCVQAQAAESGEFRMDVDALVTGPASLEIAFNVAYLVEGLAALGEPQVRLEFTNPNRPLKLGPVTGNGFTYVIMPMQIQGK